MSDVCRVSVYAGDANVDLALPSGVPVASLIPAIAEITDIVAAPRGRGGEPLRYWLSTPGDAPLDAAKSLAQLDIRDGAMLVLSGSPTPLPAPRFDDAADGVATSLGSGTWRRHAGRLTAALAAGGLATVGALVVIRSAFWANDVGHVGAAAGVLAVAGGIALSAGAVANRGFQDTVAGLTLGALATGFAATAGLLAVPGGPGAPNALLGATAGAATAVLALRIIGCGTATFTAIGCLSIVAAVAALAAAVEVAPLRAIGATCAVVSLGLIEVSARTSILLTRLSPHLAVKAAADRSAPTSGDLSAQATRADTWLTGLVAAFSASAALGAIGTLMVSSAGGLRRVGIVFATITGAALLVRSRSHPGLARAVTLTVTGTATLSVSFAVTATSGGGVLPWIAVAIVALTAGTLSVGFIAPAMTWSPVARRSLELAECVVLAAVVPLACWLCGLYGAARGLSLS